MIPMQIHLYLTFSFVFQGAPSTCVLDVGIIPFPSAVLLAVFAYVVLQRIRKNHASRFDDVPPCHSSSRVLPPWLQYIFIALIVAYLGMSALEIGRLAAARMGVGLLPLGLPATLVVLLMMCYGGRNLGFGPARSFQVSFVSAFG